MCDKPVYFLIYIGYALIRKFLMCNVITGTCSPSENIILHIILNQQSKPENKFNFLSHFKKIRVFK